MPTNLDDFLPEYLRTNEDGLPRNQRRAPSDAPREIAVVLFWTRYRCQCGAEYDGPQFSESLYLKYEDRKHNCIRYSPLSSPHAHPSLDRLVDHKFIDLKACPFCTELVGLDYFNGEIDGTPMPLVSDADEDTDTEDNSTEEVASCGDVSLESLLDAEERSASKDEDEGSFTQNLTR